MVPPAPSAPALHGHTVPTPRRPGGSGEDAATGAIYVAWPGYGTNGGYVMQLWTSAKGGKAFLGPTTVATIAGAYQGTPYLAATGGHGFVTFTDHGGLQLVDLANL